MLDKAIAAQSQKRTARLENLNQDESQTVLATSTGYDPVTGSFVATTADGGKIPYKAGQPTAPSTNIVVSVGSNSRIGFGDWQ